MMMMLMMMIIRRKKEEIYLVAPIKRQRRRGTHAVHPSQKSPRTEQTVAGTRCSSSKETAAKKTCSF